ncbi:MAG: sulfotransferase [Acidobacteria bacterium]|nr:sulfotransferase [Acidobacteriota bacterium]
MSEKRIKVLYIVGNGRSGTTILDIILGQLEGFFAVGELRRIWERTVLGNRPCGCGVPSHQCPVWTEIFREAYGGMDQVDAQRMQSLHDRYALTKHLFGMMLDPQHKNPVNPEVQSYLDNLDKLYKAIQRVSKCKVIVDASKWPMYAYFLDGLPALELYMVHVIRDPRAVAHSWGRKKEYEPGVMHPSQGAARSTAYWVVWNPAIRYLWKRAGRNYLFLPYEEFVRRPRECVAEIVRFVGEDVRDLPFENENTAVLKPTHAVAGNIARLTRGPVELKPDDEWKEKGSSVSNFVVSALGWPLMWRYGYFRGAKK